MDTNSKSAPRFNKHAEYVDLREPNSINHQDGQLSSMSRHKTSQRSVMLSPNAPEFIPKRRTDDISKPMNAMKISNLQNRLNVAQSSSNQNQHPQNIPYCHPTIYQEQNTTLNPHQSTNKYYNSGNSNYNHTMQSIPNCNNTPIQNQHVSTQQEFAGSQGIFDPTQEETYAITYIESIVNSLNENPGSFDSVAKQAQVIFEGFTENYYVLSNAMEIIFNKSIEEQNFRYMGAKLYNLLDSIDRKSESMFRCLLTFKLTYHKEEIINFIKNKGQHKVRGTTLFLAELYMQLRDNDETIKDIAQSIVFSIEQLLTNPSPENIKCICWTLKLAGYDLDKDCPHNMKLILSTLSTTNPMDVSTSRLLESVLKLKDNCWGRTEDIKEYSSGNVPYINNCDEPVFYGPDGQILTEEENMFLASISNSDINEDNDSEYECNPEMDEETESAFKDFLKNNLKM
ncbi:uncharacterized protein LOC129607431 [Condylostylus longicornis]|uniref:uncharacterized protein LOC129607431 n=1 Tax=Condylostylus longicornis TaxID=2530218 RepID=UPI00244DC6C0|nr:uncharacterized protein LOC129607431 [Condylostylus longicornis]